MDRYGPQILGLTAVSVAGLLVGCADDQGAGGTGGGVGNGCYLSDTCGCAADPCGPSCGGCLDAGGKGGTGGQDAGTGGGSADAGDGEASADGAAPADASDGDPSTDSAAPADASSGDATPDAFVPFWSASMQQTRACYRLTGYQHEVCLPADDAVLPWLTALPKGRVQHIVAGPYLAREPEGRSCCYFVGVE